MEDTMYKLWNAWMLSTNQIREQYGLPLAGKDFTNIRFCHRRIYTHVADLF